MYLKALQLHGFKSFPDKTELRFGEGVTAVVGPNGSGKSNISDAVRWVLGEQSSRSLRGSRMEDVIFSGTKERRPQGFAEVTLVLDNSDGSLNNKSKEVSVTRRYYRSGESVYLINNETVRLRDVHELFMDTGLGRDGYSMVGQGKIEELVSAKSENRRDMFEEAAGISHYRYRRSDALKKLDAAEENLVRLRDIVAELEARVGPLERQSKKAQQFLVLAGERKDLEIGLWVDLLEKSDDQIRDQINKLSVAQSHYDLTGHEIEKFSGEIDNATEETRRINVRLEQNRNRQSELEENASSAEANVSVIENSINFNDESIARILKDKDEQIKTREGLSSELKFNEDKISELEKAISLSREKLVSLTESLSGIQQSDDKYSDDISNINSELSKITIMLSQADVFISASESSVTEINARLDTVMTDIEASISLIESIKKDKEAKSSLYDEFTVKSEELENVAKGFDLREANSSKRLENAKTSLENRKLDLLAKQSRLKFLEDTEKNMEGYQGSVKAVLRDSGRGILTGIRGTVLQLIHVDEEYQTAIETALGNAIQDIVTETENDAKKAINMLKNSNAGRATFMPVSSVKGRILEEKDLDDSFGYIDLAYRLVSADSEYEEIIKSLLGRIAVCEDLDCAITMARKYYYKFKIVTLDGQVVNAGGSMTGGSKVQQSGFLARRNEIEKLIAECADISKEIENLEASVKTCMENYSKERADADATRADIIRNNEEKLAVSSEITILDSKLADESNHLRILIDERDSSDSRIADIKAKITEATAEKEKLILEQNEVTVKLEKITGGRDSLEKERENLNTQIAEINIETVSAMKEIDACKNNIDSLNIRIESSISRENDYENELKAVKDRNAELQSQMEESRKEAELLRKSISELGTENAGLISEREKQEKIISDTRLKEASAREDRERLGNELVRLEERKAALEKEQADTERKLYEDYSLTRREAKETGIVIESVPKAKQRLSELRGQIKALGNVNVGAIDEYKEVSERYEFLSGQVNDVEKSRKELLRMIDELTQQMSVTFREKFDAINENFKNCYYQLFGGGNAELILEDESDILECAINIKAQPPGKNVGNLSLLSGGEKGLTAIALLFAILKVRPAPFCIFDEVEAALDDVNVLRYAQYVRSMTDNSQFILITHRRGTMEEADVMYGVTMQEHGVSKLLELHTAEMVEKLKLDE